MKRSWGIALTFALLASTSTAHAQRGLRGRNGPAMTPYGPVTNPTTTPEWRQASGNPMVYQAIIEQKAQAQRQKLMQQQAQAMQKQQQAFEKWVKAQKARKDKDQPVDPQYQQMLDREAQYKAQLEARAAKRKPTKTRAKR